jgi:uncharacterized protein (TIGR02996 family)
VGFLMTIEDDFQNAIDANPTDWQTRLVFADWLDERGDTRAEGYRAIARNRLNACNSYGIWGGESFRWAPAESACWFCEGSYEASHVNPDGKNVLPPDWFDMLQSILKRKGLSRSGWCRSRRHAEDCAARAFYCLPRVRREELLKGEV